MDGQIVHSFFFIYKKICMYATLEKQKPYIEPRGKTASFFFYFYRSRIFTNHSDTNILESAHKILQYKFISYKLRNQKI